MRKSDFKHKLSIAVTVLVTTIILFSFILYIYYTDSNFKTNEENNSKIILDSISTQVDALYNEMDTAVSSLLYDPQIKSALYTLSNLDESQSPLDYFNQEKIIKDNLGTVMFFPNISNIFLYNSEKNLFYYSGYYLNDSDYIKNALSNNDYSKTLNEDNNKTYLPSHFSPFASKPSPVISVYRNFADSILLKDFIIEAQIPYRFLEKICNQSSFKNNKEIVILDKNNKVVYPFDTKYKVINKDELSYIKDNLCNKKDDFSNKNFTYLSSKSEYTGFNIILASNNNYINSQRIASIVLALIVTVLILLTVLGICFYILKRLLTPLNELIDYINSTNIDADIKLSLTDNGVDEFKVINESFNQMLEKLKYSTQLAYESQLKELEASFSALQAQVNPHFLYNTLNAISAASDIYGSEVTQKMCQELSLMMRYITSNEQERKLVDEINHTMNYLELMKIAHMDDFDYDINTEIETYDLIIPKLSIQPLVENCFKHAFNNTAPPWHIAINCYIVDNYYKIEIIDNGSGFTNSALDELQTFIEKSKSSNFVYSYKDLSIGGLGLKNIYSRFNIFYNGNFNFYVSNEDGCKLTIERMIDID